MEFRKTAKSARNETVMAFREDFSPVNRDQTPRTFQRVLLRKLTCSTVAAITTPYYRFMATQFYEIKVPDILIPVRQFIGASFYRTLKNQNGPG